MNDESENGFDVEGGAEDPRVALELVEVVIGLPGASPDDAIRKREHLSDILGSLSDPD